MSLDNASGGWLELLAGRLLFQLPATKSFDVKLRADECIARKRAVVRAMDSALLAVMDFDPFRALLDVTEALREPWVAAHVADALYHAGRLDDLVPDTAVSLREHFVLEYVDSLAAEPWGLDLALLYLRHCPVAGKATAAALLDRVPVETDRDAHRVLHHCAELGLDELGRTVCAVVAARRLAQGHIGQATRWLLRAGDAKRLLAISSAVIEDYLATGSLEDAEVVIHAIGEGGGGSGALAFLEGFRHLQAAVTAGDHAEASRLTCDILRRGLVPRRFIFDVLFTALPLLENPTIVFNFEETGLLAATLHALEADCKRNELIGHIPVAHIDAVRLSISRNLARATIAVQSSRKN